MTGNGTMSCCAVLCCACAVLVLCLLVLCCAVLCCAALILTSLLSSLPSSLPPSPLRLSLPALLLSKVHKRLPKTPPTIPALSHRHYLRQLQTRHDVCSRRGSCSGDREGGTCVLYYMGYGSKFNATKLPSSNTHGVNPSPDDMINIFYNFHHLFITFSMLSFFQGTTGHA